MRLVAVAAHSEPPDRYREERVREFARSLAQRCGGSVVLLAGGYWGFMKTLVDEALALGMRVILFPPVEREDADFPDGAVVLRTGLSFRLRSVAMVRSSDALVVLGGASGTMQELVTAYTEGRPVFLLLSGLPTDRLAGLAPYLDDRMTTEVKVYSEVGNLVADLCAHLTAAEGRRPKTG